MVEQLEKNKGNRIVIELVDRKQIAGIVASVNQQNVCLETDEGKCFIAISAIQIIWENMSRSLTEENMRDIAYQLRAAEDGKASSDALQPCVMAYSQPCYQPFHQSCTAAYAQSCQQHFSHYCYQAYAQPCAQAYVQPCSGAYACAQSYGQTCPQPFMPTPYEDPCFGRFGYAGHHCFGRFGFPFPYPYPYPYPPYPYPPYPYPPYPYPYPFTQETP